MDYLPVFLKIQSASVLLVGGGDIALRKARLLVSAGASISVVSLQLHSELKILISQSGGQYYCQEYDVDLLDNCALVVAATDQQTVNKKVSEDAKNRMLPVNVVDQPELCSFIFPAIVDRSPLMIAISSGGKSPVLARSIRAKIEALIPTSYGILASFVGRLRKLVQKSLPENQRRDFWEKVINGPIGSQVLAGRQLQGEQALKEALIVKDDLEHEGEVFLVGAGPGDPDLLSIKALRLLQMADVVLYDRLVSEKIVDLARRDAQRIYVGKARDKHTLPQQEISQLLVDLAKKGKCVIRLKGGDPFIFGRGGEEIELLAENHIPFQIVPGVTAASGCSAYAGIPLTHRDFAQSVRFVTGNLKDGTVNLPWQELVMGGQTLVFYMGLNGLSIICEQLMAHGRARDTHIALVEKGTMVDQRVFRGTLETMVEIVNKEQVHAPTLIIVGEVVELNNSLSWFGN